MNSIPAIVLFISVMHAHWQECPDRRCVGLREKKFPELELNVLWIGVNYLINHTNQKMNKESDIRRRSK
jgi:hypothetical protein